MQNLRLLRSRTQPSAAATWDRFYLEANYWLDESTQQFKVYYPVSFAGDYRTQWRLANWRFFVHCATSTTHWVRSRPHGLGYQRPWTPHKNFKKRVHAHALIQRLVCLLHRPRTSPGIHPKLAPPRPNRAARWI